MAWEKEQTGKRKAESTVRLGLGHGAGGVSWDVPGAGSSACHASSPAATCAALQATQQPLCLASAVARVQAQRRTEKEEKDEQKRQQDMLGAGPAVRLWGWCSLCNCCWAAAAALLPRPPRAAAPASSSCRQALLLTSAATPPLRLPVLLSTPHSCLAGAPCRLRAHHALTRLPLLMTSVLQPCPAGAPCRLQAHHAGRVHGDGGRAAGEVRDGRGLRGASGWLAGLLCRVPCIPLRCMPPSVAPRRGTGMYGAVGGSLWREGRSATRARCKQPPASASNLHVCRTILCNRRCCRRGDVALHGTSLVLEHASYHVIKQCHDTCATPSCTLLH